MFAAYHYTLTPALQTAYQSVLNLRLDDAKAQLAQVKKSDPSNLLVHFVENYADILKVFISEQDADYNALAGNEKKRLDMLSRGPITDPYRLYTQANVKLLWAATGLKFGAYTAGFTKVKEAYSLLQQNEKRFPSFMPNKMALGVMHTAVGNIPESYKWGVKTISGLDGTVQQGMAEIEQVINYSKTHTYAFEQEAMVVYAFLVLHVNNNSEKAWTLINSSKLNVATSPLSNFAIANVALRTGRCDKAIETLLKKPSGAGYFPLYYLDYMLGEAKLFRQDKDADVYLTRFVTNFKGKNYLKAAYQRLAWHALLQNNPAGYKKNIAAIAGRGSAVTGSDKNAQQEAKSGLQPNIALLKSRLMFDGGYYARAYEFLKTKSAADFASNKAYLLEYNYRMGRIAHQLGKTAEALTFYQTTIEKGKSETYYFACNAALKSGELYEAAKNKPKARECYNLCLSLNPPDHANALHALAKAGLQRVR